MMAPSLTPCNSSRSTRLEPPRQNSCFPSLEWATPVQAESSDLPPPCLPPRNRTMPMPSLYAPLSSSNHDVVMETPDYSLPALDHWNAPLLPTDLPPPPSNAAPIFRLEKRANKRKIEPRCSSSTTRTLHPLPRLNDQCFMPQFSETSPDLMTPPESCKRLKKRATVDFGLDTTGYFPSPPPSATSATMSAFLQC